MDFAWVLNTDPSHQITIVDVTPFEYELVKHPLTGHYVVAPF